MKRLSALLLFALFISVGHSQQLINCATSTPCTNGGPTNTGTGDNLPTAGTKINANFSALPSALFNGAPLPLASGGIGATSLSAASIPVQSGSITSGHCATWLSSTSIGDAGAACGGGSSTTFQVNGTGLISSTTLNYESGAATNGLTLTFSNPTGGNVQLGLTGWPTLINGDCLTNNGTTLSWGSCGSGGSSAFSALTGGTNTAAAMVVGTGASLAVTGSGTISATNTTAVNGAAVPASAAVLASNSSNQLASASTVGTGSVVLATSPTITTPTISGALTTNVTGSTQCVHANSAGVLSGTGSDCGSGGGSPAFSAITAATNTTAAMLVGTGASLGPTGSGTVTANAFSGTVTTTNGGTGAASLTAANIPILSGAITSGHCVEWLSSSPLEIEDSGAGCGSGGSTAFSALTGSTNTTAAMLVGTGASLAASGTGVLSANQVNGAAVPASTTVLASNSSGQLIAATNTGTGSNVLATSPTLVTPALGTPSALVLTNATGLPAAALPALTGDVTSTAGTAATTVVQVNGAVVPTSASVVSTNASKQLTSATTTGSGSVVLGTSPTLTTPALGTPSALVLTNATGLPAAALPAFTGDATTTAGSSATTVVRVNGAAVPVSAAAVTTNSLGQLTAATTTGTGGVVLATSPTLTTPNLGTPSAVTLTSATGLPVATGISGLATGVATFLATPTSANLAAAVTNETGTGLLVFGTSPTLTTPVLGVATATSINGSTVPASAGGLAGSTGAFTSGHCLDVGSTSPLEIADSGAACGGGGGSGTVNSGTAGDLAYYATTGTAVSQATVGAGLTLNTGNLTATAAINAQTGTTYTVLATDSAKLVTLSNASATAVTLPVATTTGFGAGFSFDVQNKGAGTVTITPTTSTINGSASLAVAQNRGCSITSDGTNYQVSACTSLLATGTSTIASGTAALGTSAIASGACATVVTVSATGVATTDAISSTPNGDITAVTGYAPTTSGILTIYPYPTANNVNYKVCNSTASSITPGAVTLNWRVVR